MGNRSLRRLGHGWRAKLALVLTFSLLISLLITQGIGIAQEEVYLSSKSGVHLDANDPIDPSAPIDKPVNTTWHELYPNYCDNYVLTDWEDNNDEILSPCDQIELTNNVTQASAWYHVDAVTITIWVKPLGGEDIYYLEWDGGYGPYIPEEMIDILYASNCTLWHEVYPEFCNWYHLLETEDTGPPGLSYCDNIHLYDLETETSAWYHIEGVTTDIIVSPKPVPPGPIPNPVCTYWHEIYPTYCTWHHLSDWDDNGDDVLSPCDSIELTNNTTGAKDWYHVDEVTLTIWVTPWTGEPAVPGETLILEFEGGYNYTQDAMVQPVCTDWHEIYPQFCNRYHIDYWDDNGDDKLSFCDWIDLKDLATNQTASYHVDDVATNIIVTLEPPQQGCGGG